MLESLNDWVAFNKESLIMGAVAVIGGGLLWGLAEAGGTALMQRILRGKKSDKEGGE